MVTGDWRLPPLTLTIFTLLVTSLSFMTSTDGLSDVSWGPRLVRGVAHLPLEQYL